MKVGIYCSNWIENLKSFKCCLIGSIHPYSRLLMFAFAIFGTYKSNILCRLHFFPVINWLLNFCENFLHQWRPPTSAWLVRKSSPSYPSLVNAWRWLCVLLVVWCAPAQRQGVFSRRPKRKRGSRLGMGAAAYAALRVLCHQSDQWSFQLCSALTTSQTTLERHAVTTERFGYVRQVHAKCGG
jgi:hypothetical protein